MINLKISIAFSKLIYNVNIISRKYCVNFYRNRKAGSIKLCFFLDYSGEKGENNMLFKVS